VSGGRIRGRRAAAVAFAALTLVGCTAGAREDAREARLARGEELYQANCMRCHGGATGGSISDIPPRHNAEGHTWHHPDCQLVDIVAAGMPRRPGLPDDAPTMPAFGDRLSDDDVRAILAYLKTWWKPDQRQSQEEVTARSCR
jgi:mono/diheme cytochrome c family protein